MNFLACLLAGGLALFVVQRLAWRFSPLAPSLPARGHVFGDALAVLAGAQLASLFLLLTARPITSLLLVCCIGALLLVLNRVKENVLHEPLVLVDAYLLPQVFRYPGLYFPFLPVRPLAAALLLFLGCFVFMLQAESPLIFVRTTPGFLLTALVAFGPICIAAVINTGHIKQAGNLLLKACPVSHNAVDDAFRVGALASALMHPILAGVCRAAQLDFLAGYSARPEKSAWPETLELNFFPIPAFSQEQPCLREQAENVSRRPHVLLIQAESFYDPRPLLSVRQREMLGDFLPNWDALAASGRTLPTPPNIFGAYTMRTEFEVLTGLSARALGPWAFNPYLLAAKRPMWSLARHFKQGGYATLCIHPYARRFFRRDAVMPNLGFDEFVALESLMHLPHCGPHTSDIALGKEILSRLDASAHPVFCFAITMEAHGPWLENRLSRAAMEEILPGIDLDAFSPPVQSYLCHLRHMDMLVGLFRQRADGEEKDHRPCQVWAYGDHPPALDFRSA